MDNKLYENIEIVSLERIVHYKALEEYIHVIFSYSDKKWDGWVPVEYRRTGISIKQDDYNSLVIYLNNIYEQMNPNNYEDWLREQEQWWREEKRRATTTKSCFNCLAKGNWKCTQCQLPNNRNLARRIQDLKEFGYTLATDIRRYCHNCKMNTTHIIMLPIKRLGMYGNGYESFSQKLRKRIIKILGGIDVYEGNVNVHCLPDHKFSEIRWDEYTKSVNPDSMTDDEIRKKFQLLTNQRNQQKREICRSCFQTGKRGSIYGIPYYYSGTANWDPKIPVKGKEAERGCIGCPWYDIEAWRRNLLKALNIK